MPAKKHNFTVTEIKAGIMVIVSTAVLLLFIAVVTGWRTPSDSLTFYASFADTAGLNPGADVRFGGSKAGRVADITLDDKDQSRLLVVADVRKGTPVNVKSQAYITQTTLTAEKHLEISTGDKGVPLLPSGSEIPTRPGGLFDQAGEVAESVQVLLADVRALLGVPDAQKQEADGKGKLTTVAKLTETVNTTLEKGTALVEDVRGVIDKNRDALSSILEDVETIGTSAKQLVTDIQGIIAENRADIRSSVEGVRGIIGDVGDLVGRVSDVSGRLNELADSLQGLLDNTESLSGDAQAMLEANRPVIEDMLLDLREATRHLKDLARTMKDQPEAVIRGKSPAGRR